MTKTIILIIILMLFFFFALLMFQRKLMYFPSQQFSRAETIPPFVVFEKSDGEFLGYIRESKSPKRVLVYFHGNAGEAMHRAWVDTLVVDTDIVLVLAEYPGYGLKKGEPTETNIKRSALELLDEIAARLSLPVTLVGESLGTGVASLVASHPSIDRLAFIAPFVSTVEVGVDAYPFLPVRTVMLDRYESLKHLQGVKHPLMVIHGNNDRVISVRQGRGLVESYEGKEKTLIELDGVGHNDIAGYILEDQKAQPFRDFVNEK